MNITEQIFGQVGDQQSADLFTLTNDHGIEIQITNYGGIITSLRVPDRTGRLGNIVLGFDTLDEYIDHNPFFGALVGRYANRIAGGCFTLDDTEYRLVQNNGPNHLHGGTIGFDKVLWQAETGQNDEMAELCLTYLSPDGEEGYPGNLVVEVRYRLNNQNELSIDYSATTDKPTIINLTNHSYFNLAEQGDILSHEIMIAADHFTPIDETLIPTGEIRSVANTPMDFRQSIPIGARIDQIDQQLQCGSGYDHNWILNQSDNLEALMRVYEPTTGRVMEVCTTQPGVQFYSGNMLPTLPGKQRQPYGRRSGFCLETQIFPDSPNQANFPAPRLDPGEQYKQSTTFRFL